MADDSLCLAAGGSLTITAYNVEINHYTSGIFWVEHVLMHIVRIDSYLGLLKTDGGSLVVFRWY